MKIMTLNSGSSSLKYSVWEMPARRQLCSGVAERVTIANGLVRHKVHGKEEMVTSRDFPTHEVAFTSIVDLLTDDASGVIDDVSEVGGVGHRVVHGGEEFTRSVRIDDQVLKAIEEFCTLAPLHNPANLAGIRAAMKLVPNAPHVAVFDTAFLSTLHPTYTSMVYHTNGTKNTG